MRGNYNVHVVQVECKSESLNLSDVFVLDDGIKVYVWFGPKSSKPEQFQGRITAENIRDARKGCEMFVLDENGHDDFWRILGGKKELSEKEEEVDHHLLHSKRKHELHELHEENGKFSFKKVAEGELKYNMLKSNDVFVCDVGDTIICWIGKNSTKLEKSRALISANQYIGLNKRPVWLPILTVNEGHEGKKFFEVIKK